MAVVLVLITLNVIIFQIFRWMQLPVEIGCYLKVETYCVRKSHRKVYKELYKQLSNFLTELKINLKLLDKCLNGTKF